MADPSAVRERARSEIVELVTLHGRLARRLDRLRARRARAASEHAEAIYEKALRCERVTLLLDNRIRLAAEQLVLADSDDPEARDGAG
jgi:hypothetical protein